MDRVFVSTKSPKKKGFKFLGGSNRPKRTGSDAAPTEYFPYAGGDGIDGHEFHPMHMSYEPAASMYDTQIDFERTPLPLHQRVGRVLARGSKYEVLSTPKHMEMPSVPNQDTSETSVIEDPFAEEKTSPTFSGKSTPQQQQHPQQHQRHDESPSVPSDPPKTFQDLWTLQWLNNIPTSIEGFVPLVRDLARRTVFLAPLDTVADSIEGLDTVVAVLELFILMLIGDQLANILKLICSPALFIVKLAFQFF